MRERHQQQQQHNVHWIISMRLRFTYVRRSMQCCVLSRRYNVARWTFSIRLALSSGAILFPFYRSRCRLNEKSREIIIRKDFFNCWLKGESLPMSAFSNQWRYRSIPSLNHPTKELRQHLRRKRDQIQTTTTNLRHYTFKGQRGVQVIPMTVGDASPARRRIHLLWQFIGI